MMVEKLYDLFPEKADVISAPFIVIPADRLA